MTDGTQDSRHAGPKNALLERDLGRKAYVIDRCDDAPLSDDVGPLRLVVPSDHRPARWIRQIESIEVDRPAVDK